MEHIMNKQKANQKIGRKTIFCENLLDKWKSEVTLKNCISTKYKFIKLLRQDVLEIICVTWMCHQDVRGIFYFSTLKVQSAELRLLVFNILA